MSGKRDWNRCSKMFEANKQQSLPLRIHGIGAGTGGTTEKIIKTLTCGGVHFEYYFTNVSQSSITAAMRGFKSHSSHIKFATLNIEHTPPRQFDSFFHVILSSDCIHATRGLTESALSICIMQPLDGILC